MVAARGERCTCWTTISKSAIQGQNEHIFAQNRPRTWGKRPNETEIVATLHMQLDFPVPTGPLRPPNSTISPRTAPERRTKTPIFVKAADSPKPKKNHTLGYVAQNANSMAPNPPATIHFWWFPSLKIALTDA